MPPTDETTLWYQHTGAAMLRALGIGPGQRVLDFGCGPGRYAVPLAQAVHPGGEVVALDRSAEALAELRRRLAALPARAPVHARRTDGGSTLPGLADASLDAVLLFDVLQHVEDWDALFAEVARTLRSGGSLHVYPAAGPHPGRVDMDDVTRRLTRHGFAPTGRQTVRLAHAGQMVDDTIHSFRRPSTQPA